MWMLNITTECTWQYFNRKFHRFAYAKCILHRTSAKFTVYLGVWAEHIWRCSFFGPEHFSDAVAAAVVFVAAIDSDAIEPKCMWIAFFSSFSLLFCLCSFWVFSFLPRSTRLYRQSVISADGIRTSAHQNFSYIELNMYQRIYSTLFLSAEYASDLGQPLSR